MDPGHASNPPKEGSIGILSRAVSKLEKNPMQSHFDNASVMLGSLAGGFKWPMQVAISLFLSVCIYVSMYLYLYVCVLHLSLSSCSLSLCSEAMNLN
jgi:hypothetical protein